MEVHFDIDKMEIFRRATPNDIYLSYDYKHEVCRKPT
jgi:hypothetical protein